MLAAGRWLAAVEPAMGGAGATGTKPRLALPGTAAGVMAGALANPLARWPTALYQPHAATPMSIRARADSASFKP